MTGVQTCALPISIYSKLGHVISPKKITLFYIFCCLSEFNVDLRNDAIMHHKNDSINQRNTYIIIRKLIHFLKNS